MDNRKIQHVRQVFFVKLVEKMYLDLKFQLFKDKQQNFNFILLF